MALNKLALIRYKVIDECLRNRGRRWTLENLIEKVSEALYEYEGIRDGVSKRTLQLDLQTMRSDKLYGAPIVVVDKKYYTYEDPKFSITQSKLTGADLQTMSEVAGILRHLNGFAYFGEMSEMIARLENSVQRTKPNGRNIIQFESNPLLKGLAWLDLLGKAIGREQALLICYRSFKARTEQKAVYYPYLLKEYRNRWFLIARPKNKKHLLTLALDRIESVQVLPREPFAPYPEVDFDHYFDDVIGVTKDESSRPVKVAFEAAPETVPYLRTKPLHPSQTELHTEGGRTVFQIEVVPNFELERELLGFGPSIKVLEPRTLVKRMRDNLRQALTQYET